MKPLKAIQIIEDCNDCEILGGHDGLDEPQLWCCKKHIHLQEIFYE